MANARTPGSLAESNLSASYKEGVQAFRGRTEHGLQSRPLATGTIQVTGGAAGSDTFLPTIGGTAIVASAVAWTTNHDTTATAIATAINANRAANIANGFYVIATVATDTVTVMQFKSGVIGTLATTVAASATTTTTDFSGDTNTWTEHVSGASFDGDKYYELWWDPSDIADVYDADGNTVSLADALLLDMGLYTAAQTFQLWMGDIRMASNAIVAAGPAYAVTTWETFEWLGAGYPVIIKLAADDTLYTRARYL